MHDDPLYFPDLRHFLFVLREESSHDDSVSFAQSFHTVRRRKHPAPILFISACVVAADVLAHNLRRRRKLVEERGFFVEVKVEVFDDGYDRLFII